MIMHPDQYEKQYDKLIAEMQNDHNIDLADPMYEDRLDEAYNAMQDSLMIDLLSIRPLS